MRVRILVSAIALQFLSFPMHAADVHVIPPGQESAVKAMLELPPQTVGGCSLLEVQISGAVIQATLACIGGPASLALHHLADAPDAPQKTAQFAVTTTGNPPPAFVQAIVDNVKAHEAGFHWQTIAEQPKRPRLRTEQPENMTASQWAAMQKGQALYGQGKMPEAYEVFVELARETTVTGVLGMVVATLAPSASNFERVQRFRQDADDAPTDPLKQFLAGVALHYYGHRGAQTREEKHKYYRDAIPYLERARVAFPNEARVFIYLAVSHFRLGHQKEAEEAIERAVVLGEHDADAYYCRGEVFQRVNLPRAIEDVKKYIAVTEPVAREMPGFVSPEKQKRVAEMLRHLEAFQAGTETPTDLFDPLPDRHAENEPWGRESDLTGPILGGLAVLAAGVGFWLWRRKRGTST